MSDFVMDIDVLPVLDHVIHHTKISKRLNEHFFVKISIYHADVRMTVIQTVYTHHNNTLIRRLQFEQLTVPN